MILGINITPAVFRYIIQRKKFHVLNFGMYSEVDTVSLKKSPIFFLLIEAVHSYLFNQADLCFNV